MTCSFLFTLVTKVCASELQTATYCNLELGAHMHISINVHVMNSDVHTHASDAH